MTLTFFELLGRSANVSLSRLPLSASNESNEADWGPRFWWVDSRQGDPQLPATKLMEWKSHEIHIFILSQEIRNMHLSFNVHGGNFWISHFFRPAFFSDLENSCNVRSWMALRRIFPRSWLMIRRMKVPWSQETWSFLKLLQLGTMRMYLNLDMRLYYCRWFHVYALPRREDLSRKIGGLEDDLPVSICLPGRIYCM